jgi:hypothetical protein
MLDPVTIITTIGAGLALVDQFRDLVLKWRGEWKVPGTVVQRSGDKLQVVETATGKVVEEMAPERVQLDKWQQTRYDALYRAVETNYTLYFRILGRIPGTAIDEAERLELRAEQLQKELCRDFRDMVALYERAMNTHFPDHYELLEVCESGPQPSPGT